MMIPSNIKFVRIAAICLLAVMAGCPESFCHLLGETPEQSISWPSRRGSGEVRASGNFIYKAFHSDSPALEVWQWSGNNIKKTYGIQIDTHVMSAAVCSNDLWICDLYDKQDHRGVFYIGSLKSEEVIHRWKPPHDWHIQLCQGSRNGRYVAAWCQPENYSREPHDKVRFGLLTPDGKAFDWDATLTKEPGDSPGAMIHHVVPSDDGAYIGVAGWKNGVVMIDVTAKEVLWKIKPEWEVDTNDLAFTPDSKLIYAGGTTGLVYGMKVKTGEVVSRWWATLSGDSEYGHYIDTVSVSPDGKFVAAGTIPNGLVFLFSTKDGQRYILKHGGSGVYITSFSPDSKRLATYGAGQIKIWKLPEEADEKEAAK